MPEYREVNVLIGKESYELAIGLVGFVQAVRDALSDGWQAGEDIPKILSAAIANLLPAVEGMDKLPEEVKMSVPSAVQAAGFLTAELTKVFMDER